MRGSIQSANYTPKSSCGRHGAGWKLDLASGDFEINGPDVQPPDPQMITVTVGEWAESDFPGNAVERYKFIGDQVMKIPTEHRDSAEFSTGDISFDRDSSDIRTTLTYERPETADEASARLQACSGTSIKLEKGKLTVSHGGVTRAVTGNLDQLFVVDGDQVYISEALIDEGLIDSGKLKMPESQFLVKAPQFTVKMQLNPQGHYVVAGIGFGIDPSQGETTDGQTDMERAVEKGDAAEIMRLLSSTITETWLGQGLCGGIANIAAPAETIRQVIREELRPGGMLHRR